MDMRMCGVVALVGSSMAGAQPTARVNEPAGAVQGNGINIAAAVNHDGRHVIFASTSTNLVAGGTTGRQIFAADRDPDGNGVFDEGNTVVTLMSLGIDGLPGNGSQGGFNGQFGVDCSADGRFAVWSGQSTNLVPNDTSGFGSYDVFVRDRDPDGNGVFDEGNGVNERVNISFGGGQANSPDSGADQFGITGDGRYVVYSSSATNLILGDSMDNVPNIYLHDRQLGTNTRLDTFTATQNFGSRWPQISTDGAWVAYTGYANQVNTMNNHVFVVDSGGSLPVIVSRDDNGVPGDNASGTSGNTRGSRLSGDGRFVAFISLASNLDITRPNDQPSVYKLFLHDRDADGNGVFDEPGGFTTRRVDVAPNGDPADGFFSRIPDLSDDGRLVFSASASNLVAGDTTPSNLADVYFYEPGGSGLQIVSRATSGDQANNSSYSPVISGDGSQAVFISSGTNLVGGDTNGRDDVFARTLGTPPCNAADLAAPLGTLDLADINAFVAAFIAQQPAGDIDGNGIWDLADVNLFVNAFAGGCP